MSERRFEFYLCLRCNGLGVLDSGRNCRECGGRGTGRAGLGSGEIILDAETGRRVSLAEFSRAMEETE